ncbi:oligosaccharide flippase family protein [Aureimonas sp. ME7]|uniref:oligosaccharide flippase family protein n=1 Tax=Aureimonas sp. ME7 TaxID=2744252 RepID=UPI0015F35940|nr:oligosaccharide flippase family protein [Aureimonas sp. ME7]
MNLSEKFVLRGTAWTVGTYGVSTVLRFGSNVVLSRLVAPEVFGVMLIINTLRNGLELLSDVGIGQNIVHSPNGGDRAFRDTAWTIQLLRGLFLFAIFFAAATPLSRLYGLPTTAFEIAALSIPLLGASSISIYLLQRRLRVVALNLFDLAMDAVGVVFVVGFALISPTIWSLIYATVVATGVRTVATFFLPEAAVRFEWNRDHAGRILSFGRWIYIASLLSFACASVDKLFLGQAIPLAVLGVYGIARNIAELPAALAGRLGHSLLFPLISGERDLPRALLHAHLVPIRRKLLIACAAAIGLGAAFADVAVDLVYDARYVQAGWMLSVLLLGAFVAVLCSLNEYVLLGVGRPLWGAGGNLAKLLCLALGLTVTWGTVGLGGVIVVIALADLPRYLVIAAGQIRERLPFLGQDLLATLLLFGTLALASAVRWQLGYGTAFSGMAW